MKTALIYYMKSELFRDLNMGLDFLLEHKENIVNQLSIGDLKDTHTLLAVYPASSIDRPTMSGSTIDLEEIFTYFQGEVWSRNGEAKPLIRVFGLKHTSMSVGDLVVYDNEIFFCDNDGWENITKKTIKGLRKP